jgi:hypothetical protein
VRLLTAAARDEDPGLGKVQSRKEPPFGFRIFLLLIPGGTELHDKVFYFSMEPG